VRCADLLSGQAEIGAVIMNSRQDADGAKPDQASPLGVRVFISYAHDDAAHEELVRQFWLFLRQNGIDARVDLPASERRQDWAQWMTQQVRDADRVLIVASPQYRRRAEGDAGPDEGRGVQWEARLIRDRFYADQEIGLQSIVPVILPGCSVDDIPLWLSPAATTHYRVSAYSVKGADKLLRLLTVQPLESVPPLGTVPVLPPRNSGADRRMGRRRRFGLISAGIAAMMIAVSATVLALSYSAHKGNPRKLSSSHPIPTILATGSFWRVLPNPKYLPTAVAFSPDGNTLAVGGSSSKGINGSTYVWNLATSKIVTTIADKGNDEVNSVAFSADGTRLAVCNGSGGTYLWSLVTGKMIAHLVDPAFLNLALAVSVKLSKDGRFLAVSDLNSTYLWSLTSYKIIDSQAFPGSFPTTVQSMALSPDGRTVAVSDSDGGIYLWKRPNHQIVTLAVPGTSGANGNGTNEVAFTPDGTTLIAGEADGSINLWNISTGKMTASFANPGAQGIAAIAIASNGGVL